jgi:hypothetical protein
MRSQFIRLYAAENLNSQVNPEGHSFEVLYKSSGQERDYSAVVLHDPEVKLIPDPHKASKPDSFFNCEYALCHNDAIMILNHHPNAIMDAIAQHVTHKPSCHGAYAFHI